MTRKIVRTITKVATAIILTITFLFLLDRNLDVLPDAIHEYMPQHHVGTVITDITIVTCSSINPFSSCNLDDGWIRINKDLYLGKSMLTSGYVHYMKKKEEEIQQGDSIVIDVKVGRLDPTSPEGTIEPHEQWEARPNGLWVKLSSKKHASNSDIAVTMVDVLFGDDAVEVREGWSMNLGTSLLIDAPIQPHLTIRRGAHKDPAKPKLRLRNGGKFKILQVSDLHLSTGVGACRDAIPDEYDGGKCQADPRTLDFVSKMLDEEKPDLVVLSGDQVNGDTAPDAQTAIFKYASLLIARKIPYVSIFGNHDDEGASPRAAQMRLIEHLPYCLSQAGSSELPGVGNYYVEVLAQGSDHSAITIYLLDSHSYSPDEKHYPGYDWVKPAQIEWFKETSISLHEKHKEYRFHHINTAFIHIPLPEYTIPKQYHTGQWWEGVTAPTLNSGFKDALVERNVAFVSCGHDHVNDYCALSTDNSTGRPQGSEPQLWMCYAGGSGFGGYGGYYGFTRRVRVFDFEMGIGRVKTWKRIEWGEGTESRWDEQIIVDGAQLVGAPEVEDRPAPGGEGI